MRASIDIRPPLQDRRAECDELDQLIARARTGTSAVVVLRGEAGAGKTALLEYLLFRANACRVVSGAGVESEMEFAFAGLHQICAPFLERLDRLPAPQRDALSTAFGLRAGDPPDRFLVGLAVLTLLAEVAEERPLVCVIDDAQWLDRASAQVLGFVARRLAAESVVLAFALREPTEDHDLSRLPELWVGPLPDADARALLASAMPGRVDEAFRERIIAEAQGNPLALLELPRGHRREAFAGGFATPDALSVSSRIERSFLRRLSGLPPETRLLMLVAAADQSGDPVLIWNAAERLGIQPEAAAPAREAALLALGEQVRFRHPLVRSVVYGEAAGADRRLVHRALAVSTNNEADPDRRAWHLAAASEGPDDEVASALEESAGRARARGGIAASAAFLKRATALTRDPARRAERALAAAQAGFQAGAFDDALALLATAEGHQPNSIQSARAALLRAHVAFVSGLGRDAPPLLFEAARQMEEFDANVARETYLIAWAAAVFAGHLAGPGDLERICRAIQALGPRPGTPHPIDLLLEGLARLVTHGRAEATPALQRAGKALMNLPAEDVLRWGWLATAATDAVWDPEGTRVIAERHSTLLREVGALAQLPNVLGALGNVATWSGDFAGAASLAAEAQSVATATGSRYPPTIALRLLALQGNDHEATALIDDTIDEAGGGGQGLAATNASWAAAQLYNGLGRYGQAMAMADRASSATFEPFVSMWALPELVEAAARAGERVRAHDALERLAETTQPCGTRVALGIEARCRALVSDGAQADQLYHEAIDGLTRTPLRTELARSHLVYGEWLRREGRRVDARSQLRTAYDMLVSIGMEAFAERARRELLATGERVRKRTAETRDQLTPQEEHIARLARAGLSNTAIGAHLFLSPRTVEWHLRNVFSKLGVSSRKELGAALPWDDPRAVAG